jgi:hypothetical protein
MNEISFTEVKEDSPVRKATRVGSLFITAFVILGIAATMPKHGSPIAYAHDHDGLVGLWDVTVVVNPPSASEGSFIFTDLIAFNQGGTLTATSTAFNPHTSEVLGGPLGVDTSDGYGVWAGEGDTDRVRVKFTRFLFAGSNADSTGLYEIQQDGVATFVPGQQVGTNTVDATGVLHGDGTLSGTFTTQFLELNGNPVFSGSGTFTATRAPRP